MAKPKKPARLERRVRVIFFLVAEKEEEREAILDLIEYLDIQYVHLRSNSEKLELPVTGFTHSAIPFSNTKSRKDRNPRKTYERGIFWGHWWTEEEEEAILISVKERVVFFLIDLPAVAEEWKTDENIILLKEKIFETYAMYGSPQEEIWIVKQDIYRYA